MTTISVSLFKKILETERDNSTIDFINVCTPVEYAEKHIEGVANVPLDTLENNRERFKDKQTIYVHCKSGTRGAEAVKKLEEMSVPARVINVEGGLGAWEESGFPTKSLGIGKRLPLMRQVFLAAGALVLSGIAAYYVTGSRAYLGISAFVGAGLMFSGLTGWCGLQLLLARMPWNKVTLC